MDYAWHKGGECDYVYCAEWDWQTGEEASDYGTVCFDPENFSRAFGTWVTSADNGMCYAEADFSDFEQAKAHVEEAVRAACRQGGKGGEDE